MKNQGIISKNLPEDGSERFLVGEGGFEPSKSKTTDLQSAPFGHSGTPPYLLGAGGRTRTPDLLITNQLLYQLSYTGRCSAHVRLLYYIMNPENVKRAFLQIVHCCHKKADKQQNAADDPLFPAQSGLVILLP